MEIEQASADRLEFVHEGEPFLRYGSLFVGSCVAVVPWGGAWGRNALGPDRGGFFLWLLQRSTADSRAVFDREAGHFQLTHSRNGRPLAGESAELAAIERVIVDVATGTGPSGDRLSLRPAPWPRSPAG